MDNTKSICLVSIYTLWVLYGIQRVRSRFSRWERASIAIFNCCHIRRFIKLFTFQLSVDVFQHLGGGGSSTNRKSAYSRDHIQLNITKPTGRIAVIHVAVAVKQKSALVNELTNPFIPDVYSRGRLTNAYCRVPIIVFAIVKSFNVRGEWCVSSIYQLLLYPGTSFSRIP